MNQTGHQRDMHAREELETVGGDEGRQMASIQVTTKAPKPGFHGSLVWKCTVPDCDETIQFTQEDGDVIAFMIVHHLVRKHGFSKRDVIAYDPALKDGAAEYVGYSLLPQSAQ